MRIRIGILLVFCVLLGAVSGLSGQTSAVLEEYIQYALANSPLIKREVLALQERRAGLEIAERMNLPEVRLGSTYTLAEGGRTIVVPVGDLMNPVYSALNQLTQSNAFPQINNVNEQFLPNNFYDVRFRVQQPLWNAEIQLNRKIRGAQVTLQEIQIAVVKRSLIKEVKTAYFRYLQTAELERIYANTLQVVHEQKRVNESLVRNGKALPAVLQRDESEIANVENLIRQTQLQTKTAVAFFNYLLHRAPETPVIADPVFQIEPGSKALGSSRREELAQLQELRNIQDLLAEMEAARRKPVIGTQLDLGSQNFDFKWGGYALLGINLEIPIWNAGRQKLKTEQAQIAALMVDEQLRDLEHRLQLEVTAARNALDAAQATLESFQTQLGSARRYYQDTERRYREGAAMYLELLDAQTQVMNLETREALSKYEILIRYAELERALASVVF